MQILGARFRSDAGAVRLRESLTVLESSDRASSFAKAPEDKSSDGPALFLDAAEAPGF
jgi:hypothetical protein